MQIFEFIISGFATLSFAFFFHCPKRSLIYASIIGGCVWTIYKTMVTMEISYIISAFFSAFVAGLCSEFLARKLKMPATVFLIPSLVPLVPGAGMYYTMYYLIQQDYLLFQAKAFETIFLAGAFAVGVVASSSIFKIISYYIKK